MAFETFKEQGQRADLDRERAARLRATPLSRYQVVSVTFDTPDKDVDIAHELAPQDPEQVCFQVVRQNGTGVVYQDMTPTRLPWQQSHVFLRSSAPTDVEIMLFMPVSALDPLPVRFPTTPTYADAFGVISVSGQSDVVAGQLHDTLTLVAGTGVTITTDPVTDSVTINASGSGGSPASPDTSVQFNDSGVFGGDAGFVFLKTSVSVALGSLHTITGSSESLAVGSQHTITGTDSVAIGFNVSVSGNDVLAAGETLVVTGSSSGVFGSAVTVGGNYNLVGGSQCDVAGAYNLAGGSQSVVAGDYNLIGGSQPAASGSYGIVGGSNNTTATGSDYALVVGWGNTLTGASNGGYIIGDQLTVTGDRNVVIGIDGSSHTVSASNHLEIFASDIISHGGTLSLLGEGSVTSLGSPTKFLLDAPDSTSWAFTLRRTDLGGTADVSVWNDFGGIVFDSNTKSMGWSGVTGVLYSDLLRLTATPFASLPVSPTGGTIALIGDSPTDVWRAAITIGGGSNTALAIFLGTSWSLFAVQV